MTSNFFKAILLIFTSTLVVSCNDDDGSNNPTGPQPTGNEMVYNLNSVSDSNVSGTATIIEMDDRSITVELDLSNTEADDLNPAHIHYNSVAEGGDIAITLGTVDGETGFSTINFTELDDNTPITYQELLDFDGYINVHKSATDLSSLIAQGNIGSNVGSDDSLTYNVTNSGDLAYIFSGDTLVNASNPSLELTRGKTYKFNVNAPGHPFWIKSVQGNTSANAYNTGVTNNGASIKTVTFVVPASAPDTLYYNCENHAVMTNTLIIKD